MFFFTQLWILNVEILLLEWTMVTCNRGDRIVMLPATKHVNAKHSLCNQWYGVILCFRIYTYDTYINSTTGRRAPFLPVDGARDHKRSLPRTRKRGSYHLNQNCGYLKHISFSTQYIVFIIIEWQALIESLFGTSMLSTNEWTIHGNWIFNCVPSRTFRY